MALIRSHALCSEKEHLKAFFDKTVMARKPGSIYICGKPGTGKTAMVKGMCMNMKRRCRTIFLNGMTLTGGAKEREHLVPWLFCMCIEAFYPHSASELLVFVCVCMTLKGYVCTLQLPRHVKNIFPLSAAQISLSVTLSATFSTVALDTAHIHKSAIVIFIFMYIGFFTAVFIMTYITFLRRFHRAVFSTLLKEICPAAVSLCNCRQI